MCGMKRDMGGAAGLMGAFEAAVEIGAPGERSAPLSLSLSLSLTLTLTLTLTLRLSLSLTLTLTRPARVRAVPRGERHRAEG